MAKKEEMINIPLWKFKEIYDALRLTNNIYKCHTKETAYDRQVMQAYGYVNEALENVGNASDTSSINNEAMLETFTCINCGIKYDKPLVGGSSRLCGRCNCE